MNVIFTPIFDDFDLHDLLVRGPPGGPPNIILHLAAPRPLVLHAHIANLDGALVLAVVAHELDPLLEAPGTPLQTDGVVGGLPLELTVAGLVAEDAEFEVGVRGAGEAEGLAGRDLLGERGAHDLEGDDEGGGEGQGKDE